jgi:hypothetical protein
MRPLVPIRILVVYAVLVPAADAETLTFQGWVAAHPVLHDVLLIVIAVILVGGATAIGVFKWVRHLALRTLEGREAKGRLNRLIASAMRIDEGDIRRAVTPDWIATMVDSPAARTRIVAALGTDEGRMAVAEALKGSEAKREIAAAMLDEGVRQALIVILTTYVDARAAIANVVHEVDLRISVQETIESGELDEAILDVVFGELVFDARRRTDGAARRRPRHRPGAPARIDRRGGGPQRTARHVRSGDAGEAPRWHSQNPGTGMTP